MCSSSMLSCQHTEPQVDPTPNLQHVMGNRRHYQSLGGTPLACDRPCLQFCCKYGKSGHYQILSWCKHASERRTYGNRSIWLLWNTQGGRYVEQHYNIMCVVSVTSATQVLQVRLCRRNSFTLAIQHAAVGILILMHLWVLHRNS